MSQKGKEVGSGVVPVAAVRQQRLRHPRSGGMGSLSCVRHQAYGIDEEFGSRFRITGLGEPFVASKQPNQYVDLLREELRLSGIELRDILPTWARKADVLGTVLQELVIALIPTIHEGLIPSYGALVLPVGSTGPAFGISLDNGDLPLARAAGDGSSALVAWQESKFKGLSIVEPSATPDLQLARIVRSERAIIIRRDRGGLVTLYAPEHNLTHASRRWTLSPAINPALAKVSRVAPMINQDILAQILEFAFYVLSPWRIGATLVWVLSDRKWLDVKVNLEKLRMSVAPQVGYPPLGMAAHLLAQHDGATILSREGKILATGVHLNPTAKAEELIPIFRGTRHTSAKRASYDFPDTLIVTVSADGPVTVFSDGVNILELWWYSADVEAQAVEKLMGESGQDSVFTFQDYKLCSNCGKTSCVETLTIAGWREHEEADCPVCGSVVASDMCWKIHANLVKVF